jgi:hypothetical protein
MCHKYNLIYFMRYWKASTQGEEENGDHDADDVEKEAGQSDDIPLPAIAKRSAEKWSPCAIQGSTIPRALNFNMVI